MAQPTLKKGMDKAIFAKLVKLFPDAGRLPRVDDTLAKIQRAAGQQEVLDIIQRDFING